MGPGSFPRSMLDCVFAILLNVLFGLVEAPTKLTPTR